jgi:hypothetical protein
MINHCDECGLPYEGFFVRYDDFNHFKVQMESKFIQKFANKMLGSNGALLSRH